MPYNFGVKIFVSQINVLSIFYLFFDKVCYLFFVDQYWFLTKWKRKIKIINQARFLRLVAGEPQNPRFEQRELYCDIKYIAHVWPGLHLFYTKFLFFYTKFLFFYTKFLFLHQFFVFLHQFFVFLHQIYVFTPIFCFFTPIFFFFYTKFLLFLHQIFAFFTPNFCFFYTNFCFFYTKFLLFLHQIFVFLHDFFYPKFFTLIFLHQIFAFFTRNFCFFTRIFCFFTRIFCFFTRIFCFFTRIFLHQILISPFLWGPKIFFISRRSYRVRVLAIFGSYFCVEFASRNSPQLSDLIKTFYWTEVIKRYFWPPCGYSTKQWLSSKEAELNFDIWSKQILIQIFV